MEQFCNNCSCSCQNIDFNLHPKKLYSIYAIIWLILGKKTLLPPHCLRWGSNPGPHPGKGPSHQGGNDCGCKLKSLYMPTATIDAAIIDCDCNCYRNQECLKCNGILYYKLSLKYYKSSPLLVLRLQHMGKHAPLSLLTP